MYVYPLTQFNTLRDIVIERMNEIIVPVGTHFIITYPLNESWMSELLIGYHSVLSNIYEICRHEKKLRIAIEHVN